MADSKTVKAQYSPMPTITTPMSLRWPRLLSINAFAASSILLARLLMGVGLSKNAVVRRQTLRSTIQRASMRCSAPCHQVDRESLSLFHALAHDLVRHSTR